MTLTVETGPTLYDAAHLACAIELGATLVTEDGSLRETAVGRIGVSDVAALE